MMIDIQKVDLVGMNNGAHYEFMKVVNDRFVAETTLSTNASAKKAMEALAAALKEEDRCLVISRRNLITDDIRAADKTRDDIFRSLRKAINGFTDAPVADVAKAGKVLQQCVADYAINPAMEFHCRFRNKACCRGGKVGAHALCCSAEGGQRQGGTVHR